MLQLLVIISEECRLLKKKKKKEEVYLEFILRKTKLNYGRKQFGTVGGKVLSQKAVCSGANWG